MHHPRPRFPRAHPLPWPMSRVERDVLHSLWLEAQRTGQPITVIVEQAVIAHLDRRHPPAAHTTAA